jgi:DNA-binding response OmpR family regulator
VLILEDDNSMVKLYNHWLTKLNVKVECCPNGQIAMDTYFKKDSIVFDLIIADLHLEDDKTGEQVVNFLEPKTPILFLSAFIDQELRIKFKKEKHVKFMEKKNIGYSNFLQRIESLTSPAKKSSL